MRHGRSFDRKGESKADGSFLLADVPPGTWKLETSLGSFAHTSAVTVEAGKKTRIPDDQACFDSVNAAVVLGRGDHIESLLGNLKLKVTTFDGTSAGYASSALPLLKDVDALKKFDIVFIDCAAGNSSGQIDLGDAAVPQALHDYVAQGGSLYASDWAFLFLEQAFPDKFAFDVGSGAAPSSPFDTQNLLGYGGQDVSATVGDAKLAAFLGKPNVTVSFPKRTYHWGLMQDAPPGVDVLIAGNAQMCAPGDRYCDQPAGTATNIPLAVMFHAGPDGKKGGNVVYTSFHNVEQSSTDVEQILKYLVFQL